MEHDEMCPVDLRQRKAYDGCLCDGPDSLIARVRADERTKAAGRVEARYAKARATGEAAYSYGALYEDRILAAIREAE